MGCLRGRWLGVATVSILVSVRLVLPRKETLRGGAGSKAAIPAAR
ncbi:hypothetical protein OROMI_004261 [Orobanche minor]